MALAFLDLGVYKLDLLLYLFLRISIWYNRTLLLNSDSVPQFFFLALPLKSELLVIFEQCLMLPYIAVGQTPVSLLVDWIPVASAPTPG